MTQMLQFLGNWIGIALCGAALGYAVIAWFAVQSSQWILRTPGRGLFQPVRDPGAPKPAVTVLKPLCGAEPATHACLRSFCDQDYPRFQIVFGVRDPLDPAVAVVRSLQREWPRLDIELAIDAQLHGSSLKVSNLINMMRLARHDQLVIADSDVSVPRDYLAAVVAPLADPAVGIVTCPYRGCARRGIWSLLLAMFINDWFMPSVFVSALLGSHAFVSGATIGLRRATLAAIGGFAAIADQLADDYRLGELTRRLGLTTVMVAVSVDTEVSESSAADLVRHELRWLRTIRAVRPGGYAFSVVTFGLPVSALGCLLAHGAGSTVTMLALTLVARLMLHFDARRTDSAPLQLLVLPLNDLLAFSLFCWSFVSRSVHWRERRYRVARDGSVQPIP